MLLEFTFYHRGKPRTFRLRVYSSVIIAIGISALGGQADQWLPLLLA